MPQLISVQDRRLIDIDYKKSTFYLEAGIQANYAFSLGDLEALGRSLLELLSAMEVKLIEALPSYVRRYVEVSQEVTLTERGLRLRIARDNMKFDLSIQPESESLFSRVLDLYVMLYRASRAMTSTRLSAERKLRYFSALLNTLLSMVSLSEAAKQLGVDSLELDWSRQEDQVQMSIYVARKIPLEDHRDRVKQLVDVAKEAAQCLLGRDLDVSVRDIECSLRSTRLEVVSSGLRLSIEVEAGCELEAVKRLRKLYSEISLARTWLVMKYEKTAKELLESLKTIVNEELPIKIVLTLSNLAFAVLS